VVSGIEFGYGLDVTTAFDPTTQYNEFQSPVAAISNDGLVGLRRAGGGDGMGIVPDLATALPTPTGGGRTYTFQLRKGVRYSTGEPVLAGDIRRGIERAVVHPDTSQSANYYSAAIVGARACQEAAEQPYAVNKPRPDCDLHEGISADDRTGLVTFHLTRPTPEFLYQLALPAASAVPQDTSVDLAPGTFLPATGPYKIRSYTRKQDVLRGHARLVLVRNPHFHVWSTEAQPDGYPDRIVLETGYSAKDAMARVTDGRADLLWLGDPQTDVDRLRTAHGSELHTTPGASLNFLFLNATKPPFDNRDARRAVAFALDRAALTGRGDFLSGPVTCQLIPPDFPGHQPYCPFTRGGDDKGKWGAPDLTEARALVAKSGTAGSKVNLLVVSAHAYLAAGKRIVHMLNSLGYDASLFVRENFYDFTADPSLDWNAGLGAWTADFPLASAFVGALASCDPDLDPFNPSYYCDPKIDKQIAAAIEQQATDPVGASESWAAIDRQVVDGAATIPYGNSVSRYFAANRVGHTLIHPMTGPLISQMWIE
jgi:peptide/nickel transport system substrate-binding protein